MSQITQALATEVAATLAAGIMNKVKIDLPLDPTIADANVRQAIAMQWEIFKVYYSGEALVFGDDPTWAKIPEKDVPAVVDAIAKGVQGQGPLGTLLGTLTPAILKLLGLSAASPVAAAVAGVALPTAAAILK